MQAASKKACNLQDATYPVAGKSRYSLKEHQLLGICQGAINILTDPSGPMRPAKASSRLARACYQRGNNYAERDYFKISATGREPSSSRGETYSEQQVATCAKRHMGSRSPSALTHPTKFKAVCWPLNKLSFRGESVALSPRRGAGCVRSSCVGNKCGAEHIRAQLTRPNQKRKML